MHGLQAMCYKAPMKVAMLLFLAASPALSCDWTIISDRTDPMTDQRVCLIQSPSAKIAIGVRGQEITLVTTSAYSARDGLQIRVDDGPPILITRKGRSTQAFVPDTRNAIAAIKAGSRIRTSYRDYPHNKEGDAPICSLPSLIQSCLVPSHSSR